MKELSPELEELLRNSFQLKKALASVLPQEAVDYIHLLIVQDFAHRKFLKLTEDSET